MDNAVKILSVSDLSFRVGQAPALSRINFDIYAGETLVLLGADRANKRILMRLIAGGHLRSALYVENQASLSDIRLTSNVYYVSEGKIPFGFMTVEGYCKYTLALLKDKTAIKRVSEHLESMGLTGKLRTKLSALTPAEHKVLSAAVRLAENKPVMIINADDLLYTRTARTVLARAVKALKALGKTVILSLTDPRLAPAADRGAIIREGVLTEIGALTDILARYTCTVCTIKPRGSLKKLAAKLSSLAGTRIRTYRGRLILYAEGLDPSKEVIRALADAGETAELIRVKDELNIS